MESYSLYELNEYIKRVIALNFTETVWIHAEIAQVQQRRGQVYLDLIEKSEATEEIRAQSPAVIWYKSFLFIRNKLGELAESILQEGIVIKAKVQVSFHERYGLKLVIEDIDPSYTLGVLEMQRTEIIERLKKEGFYKLNHEIAIPSVIQKIAIISSEKAAGLQDFYAQLNANPYEYYYQTELFQAAVQGKKLEAEVKKSIKAIQEKKEDFDVLVIIRGGGSKIDLAGFDSYEVAKAIATSKLPVVTGIGHEIDQTVADLVACQSLKTPTAVANWLIDHNLRFETSLIQRWQSIQSLSSQFIHTQNVKLESIKHQLKLLPKTLIKEQASGLHNLNELLFTAFQNRCEKIGFQLKNTEKIMALAHPDNTLKRGFAIIEKQEQVVSSVEQLQKNDEIVIKMHDGKLKSNITQKN